MSGDDFIQKPIHEELMKLKIRRQLYIAQLEQENRILQLKLQSLRNRIDRVFDEVFLNRKMSGYQNGICFFFLELDKMNKRKKLTKQQK